MFFRSSVDALSSRVFIVALLWWDSRWDLSPCFTISHCQFLLPAPDVVFYANKGVKIVVQMRFSEDNKTFNYNDGECSCAQCCGMNLESPSLSSLEFNLIVLWSETQNFKNCSDLNIIKSESDWSVDLKSVQVPLSWMMAPQNWFLMTNHEKALRMLANTVKLFLLPWMRQALPCQMEISYWKSLVSAKIPIQGVYQI